jgi:hypothetical protein
VPNPETVEHPFGTIKARMGATHFLMKTLPRVAAEMALHVLAHDRCNPHQPRLQSQKPSNPKIMTAHGYLAEFAPRLCLCQAFSHDQDPKQTSKGRRSRLQSSIAITCVQQ